MSFHVSGLNQAEKIDTILDLSWKLIRIVNSEMAKELGTNDYNFFNEEITSDGDDYSKSDGIMNVYLHRFEGDLSLISKVIEIILNECRKMNVSAEFLKIDNNDKGIPRVARIKVSIPKVSRDLPPEINIANSNAHYLINSVLGYDRQLWEDGEFDASEMIKRIDYYLGEESYKKNPVKNRDMDEVFSDQDFLSGKKAESDYRKEDVVHRLNFIKSFCQWAVNHGYSKIYVA